VILAAASAVSVLVIVRHSGNVARLLDGTERRLGDGMGANS
jgi:glycerol-3-phosphate acyltransferase PlsY